MRLIDVEQGSEAWHKIRAGRVTASRVADIVRKIKSGAPSKMRATYLGELVAEILRYRLRRGRVVQRRA